MNNSITFPFIHPPTRCIFYVYDNMIITTMVTNNNDNHNNNCHTIITTSNIRWVQSSTAVLHKIRRGLALWARTASRCMPWDVLVPCWQSLVSVGMARIHIDQSWIIIIYEYLVGGLEHEFYDFPYIGNVIIPTDFHILNIADFGKVDSVDDCNARD